MPGKTKVVPIGFADCVQEFTLTGDPDPYLITYGVEVDTPPFTQNTATALRNLFVTELAPLIPPTAAVGTFRATVPIDAPDPLVFEVQGSSPGTDSTAARVSPQVAILVKKGTGLGGRRNRGRWYLPGIFIPEASINDLGVIGNAALQPALNDILAGIEIITALGTMFVFHSYTWDTPTDPGPPVGFPPPTPVVSLTFETLAATQRRRLR